MFSPSPQQMKETLKSVGWFMPPYVFIGWLQMLATRIERSKGNFSQDDLETVLARAYDPRRLAAMVANRYAYMPIISLYSETISESVSAHFLGLHHVAVGGLMPVIEGAGRTLATDRGLTDRGLKIDERTPIKTVFEGLTTDARAEVIQRKLGAVDEIVNMLDSFFGFIEDCFFSRSDAYPFADGTNRHGIAHGAYADAHYGRPLNFYKTIAAVDFLTFISSLRTARMSGFVPDPTPQSDALKTRYLELKAQGEGLVVRRQDGATGEKKPSSTR
jgi:hypothetical protein